MENINRRTFMKCMAAAATTVVVGQNVSSASALNSSIIGRLNSADGAYAEQLAFEITKDFKKSPKEFLSQLPGLKKSDINQITGLLFYGYSYENINDLWAVLSDLGETSTNLEVRTLSKSMSASLMIYVESQKQVILSPHSFSTGKSAGAQTQSSTWRISVALPTNRNYKGTLEIYSSSGARLLSCACLGLAEGNGSMSQYKGNTPTGVYDAWLAGPHSNTTSYGPYKYVATTPKSGVAFDSKRSGIWIHGGDPAPTSSKNLPRYPLRPTYGCVRVTNGDQLTIQNVLNNQSPKTGELEIIERDT